MSSAPQPWRCDLCRVKNPSTAYKCISCETPNKDAPIEMKMKAEEEEKAKKAAATSGAFSFGTSTSTAVPSSGFTFQPAASVDAGFGFQFTPSTDAAATTSNGFAFTPATSTGFAFVPSTGATEDMPFKHTLSSPDNSSAPPSKKAKIEEGKVILCTPEPSNVSVNVDAEKLSLSKKKHQAQFGLVMTVGSGDMAQLGIGLDERESVTPTIVDKLVSQNITAVAAGSLHNIVLSSEGKVLSWGCNDDGALGYVTKSELDEFVPNYVDGLDGLTITQIACGASHSIALDSQGRVYSWGAYRDASGLVGFDKENKTQYKAMELTGFNSPVVRIAAGESHSMALTKDGKVYYWGDTFIGRRASDRTKRDRLLPTEVPFHRRKIKINGRANLATTKDDITIVNIFAGGYSCFALSKSGKLWVWGPNNYTQCGIERMDDEEHAIVAPSIIPYFHENSIKVKSCASSSHFTIILAEDGRVFGVGRTVDGRLGQPKDYQFEHNVEQRDPLEITALNPKTLSSVASWQTLGDGFDDERHAYFRSAKDDQVVSVSCGEAHAFAVTKAGRLFGWGNGDLNQLGHGKEETVYEPVWVQGQHITTVPRKVIQSAGGSQHSIILAKDIDTKKSTSTRSK